MDFLYDSSYITQVQALSASEKTKADAENSAYSNPSARTAGTTATAGDTTQTHYVNYDDKKAKNDNALPNQGPFA